MRRRSLLLPLALVVIASQIQGFSPYAFQGKGAKPIAPPVIQVSSVTVDPKEIHKTNSPNAATVTVQLALLGDLPPHSVATVGVGTFSRIPPDNDISYSQSQTLELVKSPAVFFFKAQPSPKTMQGSVVIAAEIISATKGIKVINPMDTDPSLWRTQLKTVVP